MELLTADRFSEPLAVTIRAEPQPFARRMNFTCWLHDAVKAAGANIPRKDAGFWAWLTLALFDQVCPANASRERRVNEIAWYIPAFDDSRRHYRHCLFGSYQIFLLHLERPDDAAIFLSSNLNNLGHFWYQIVSRQDLISNPAIVGAATCLYFDHKRNKPKVGAVSKKPGSVFAS
jgi:hypothetical protein